MRKFEHRPCITPFSPLSNDSRECSLCISILPLRSSWPHSVGLALVRVSNLRLKWRSSLQSESCVLKETSSSYLFKTDWK